MEEKAESSKKRARGEHEEAEQAQTSLALQPLLQQVAVRALFDWTPIFDRVKHSLVFVLLDPKPDRFDDIQAVADRVKTVRGSKKRQEMVRSGSASTGFVYANGPLGPLILTCAHGLEHLFKASDPLTAATLDMFSVTVLCDHQEQEYQEAGAIGNRKYGRARIVGHDCARDTLLIGTTDGELKNFSNGVCSQGHPALVIAESIPREVKPCMLISWPSNKARTVAVGWLSSSRAINAISWPNRVQYNMNLLEVNMMTEDGSSGAPLIDTNGEVIGMLHGGFGGAHSYFVAAQYLRQWHHLFAPA